MAIFTDISQNKFWISVKEEFPTIHRKAIDIFLPFSTSYMCELSFPYLTSITNKDINCLLSIENEGHVHLCIYICKSHVQKAMCHVRLS